VELLDASGVALFAAACAWTIWASVRSGGSAAPVVGLLVACGLVLVAARTVGSLARFIVPTAVLLAAVVVAAGSRTGVLSRAALSGPLEYLNADGAFYVQAAIAGLMVACCGRPWLFRALGGAGAGFFASLPIIVHTAAAAWLVLVLPAVALLSATLAGARGARASVALFGSLFVASVTVTIVLGSAYSRTAEPGLLQRAGATVVDEARLALWHDAFGIMRDHPETGVGVRRYAFVSPIGSSDPDYRWAHHEFLQHGAETGVTGLVLLAALFLWGFVRLWAVATPGRITALAAASLAALGIHACFDYVMHFPAIPVMTAALVATGMTERGSDL
jgi:O-antigen ligase